MISVRTTPIFAALLFATMCFVCLYPGVVYSAQESYEFSEDKVTQICSYIGKTCQRCQQLRACIWCQKGFNNGGMCISNINGRSRYNCMGRVVYTTAQCPLDSLRLPNAPSSSSRYPYKWTNTPFPLNHKKHPTQTENNGFTPSQEKIALLRLLHMLRTLRKTNEISNSYTKNVPNVKSGKRYSGYHDSQGYTENGNGKHEQENVVVLKNLKISKNKVYSKEKLDFMNSLKRGDKNNGEIRLGDKEDKSEEKLNALVGRFLEKSKLIQQVRHPDSISSQSTNTNTNSDDLLQGEHLDRGKSSNPKPYERIDALLHKYDEDSHEFTGTTVQVTTPVIKTNDKTLVVVNKHTASKNNRTTIQTNSSSTFASLEIELNKELNQTVSPQTKIAPTQAKISASQVNKTLKHRENKTSSRQENKTEPPEIETKLTGIGTDCIGCTNYTSKPLTVARLKSRFSSCEQRQGCKQCVLDASCFYCSQTHTCHFYAGQESYTDSCLAGNARRFSCSNKWHMFMVVVPICVVVLFMGAAYACVKNCYYHQRNPVKINLDEEKPILFKTKNGRTIYQITESEDEFEEEQAVKSGSEYQQNGKTDPIMW